MTVHFSFFSFDKKITSHSKSLGVAQVYIAVGWNSGNDNAGAYGSENSASIGLLSLCYARLIFCHGFSLAQFLYILLPAGDHGSQFVRLITSTYVLYRVGLVCQAKRDYNWEKSLETIVGTTSTFTVNYIPNLLIVVVFLRWYLCLTGSWIARHCSGVNKEFTSGPQLYAWIQTGITRRWRSTRGRSIDILQQLTLENSIGTCTLKLDSSNTVLEGELFISKQVRSCEFQPMKGYGLTLLFINKVLIMDMF
ncbi:hypothetical protein MKX03_006292 [Papaver bracteatum]|nr:hypothetical protein MKX03_006292 [Papaver bracteatum]